MSIELQTVSRQKLSGRVSVKVTCPHCGCVHDYFNFPQIGSSGVDINHCDPNDGGCDLPFMVSMKAQPLQVEVQVGLSLAEFYPLQSGAAITNSAAIESTFRADDEARAA